VPATLQATKNLNARLRQEEKDKKARIARKGVGSVRDNPEMWCGAKKRASSGPCRNPKGYGTSHPGIGPCRFHGGNFPVHVGRAAVIHAKRLMGTPKEIDPVNAIMWCIRITAGEVEYLSSLIGDEETIKTFKHTRYDEDGEAIVDELPELIDTNNFGERQLHILIRARQEAMDRLVRFSKDAVQLGLAERQVRLAEQYGELLYRLVSGLMADLVLTPEQQKRAPAIVRKQLAAIASGPIDVPAVIDVEAATA
jgi:hypothetical protein